MQASLPATRARHDAHHAPPMWRGAAVEAAWIRDDRRDHVIQQEGDRPKSRTGPAREDRARSRGGLGTDGSRKRILLAEDYANTRDVYRAILVYGGFDVTTAEDGEEAVRLAREELPDLILMDINLPALSGWDAARMLKHGAATKDIIIIGISANTSAESHRKAEELGFQAYYTKPFSPRMVLAAVHSAFGDGDDS